MHAQREYRQETDQTEGIYAELLANRAFQGSNWNTTAIPDFNGSLIGISENPVEPIAPVLTAWAPIGDNVRMTLDRLHPLSPALPTAMEIDFPEDATGEVGFQNFGEHTPSVGYGLNS